jgi:hypothetical protein
MSLTELKEAVTALSAEERHQLRDVLDALEEGVSVEQLHEIDQILKETLASPEPLIPADKFWDEFIKHHPLRKDDAP